MKGRRERVARPHLVPITSATTPVMLLGGEVVPIGDQTEDNTGEMCPMSSHVVFLNRYFQFTVVAADISTP